MAQQERNCLLSPEASLIAGSNSLIGGKKFPAERRAKLACRALNHLPILLRQTLNLAKFAGNSLYFPFWQGIWLEGALHAAARFCRLKERCQQGFDLAKRGTPSASGSRRTPISPGRS